MNLRLPSVPVLDFIVGLPILLLIALLYVLWLVAHCIWTTYVDFVTPGP
jgi:hypothetical protein